MYVMFLKDEGLQNSVTKRGVQNWAMLALPNMRSAPSSVQNIPLQFENNELQL